MSFQNELQVPEGVFVPAAAKTPAGGSEWRRGREETCCTSLPRVRKNEAAPAAEHVAAPRGQVPVGCPQGNEAPQPRAEDFGHNTCKNMFRQL